jgi:hypothetical protein
VGDALRLRSPDAESGVGRRVSDRVALTEPFDGVNRIVGDALVAV